MKEEKEEEEEEEEEDRVGDVVRALVAPEGQIGKAHDDAPKAAVAGAVLVGLVVRQHVALLVAAAEDTVLL